MSLGDEGGVDQALCAEATGATRDRNQQVEVFLHFLGRRFFKTAFDAEMILCLSQSEDVFDKPGELRAAEETCRSVSSCWAKVRVNSRFGGIEQTLEELGGTLLSAILEVEYWISRELCQPTFILRRRNPLLNGLLTPSTGVMWSRSQRAGANGADVAA